MNTTTNACKQSKERNIGIDIGKSFLDICVYELDTYWQAENNASGIKQLLRSSVAII